MCVQTTYIYIYVICVIYVSFIYVCVYIYIIKQYFMSSYVYII